MGNPMLKSSRFFGSCVVAGTLLFLIAIVTLHLLQPNYNPLRNFISEYAVGPFGFLLTIAAYELAATFLVLLLGLRLSVHPSGFLTASCVLLGVAIICVCVIAASPIDFVVIPLDGSPPNRAAVLAALTRTDIIHGLFSVPCFASLIALLLTLPSAYKRDEKWRSFSQTSLFLGFLFLAFFLTGLVLIPFNLGGLAQRGIFLVVLIWLLLTGLRLRQAIATKAQKHEDDFKL
jgi:hypothetical protein